MTNLRTKTGQDTEVAQFLEQQHTTAIFIKQIVDFLQYWLPEYQQSQRSYMTVAIGCTGGQHRSVYVAEQIYKQIKQGHTPTQIRHRELARLDTR